jgi:hypothetical protein
MTNSIGFKQVISDDFLDDFKVKNLNYLFLKFRSSSLGDLFSNQDNIVELLTLDLNCVV